jgi:hypothetical protein
MRALSVIELPCFQGLGAGRRPPRGKRRGNGVLSLADAGGGVYKLERRGPSGQVNPPKPAFKAVKTGVSSRPGEVRKPPAMQVVTKGWWTLREKRKSAETLEQEDREQQLQASGQ